MSNTVARNRLLRRVAAAVLAALALLAGIAAYLQQSPGEPKPLQSLRVAAPRVSATALHFIALARGFFIAEGLDVLSLDASTGKAAIDMAIDGKADIGLGSDSPFVIAAMLGQPIELLTSMSVSSGAVQIVTRADGAIQAPRDLVGQRVGYTGTTASDYFLWAYLIRQSIDPKQAKGVSLPPPELVRQLVEGTVDAVAIWQPFIEMAHKQLGANFRAFQAAEIYQINTYASARPELARKRPEVVQAYIRALVKASQFAEAHADEAIAITAREVKMSPEQMRAEWNNVQLKVQLTQAQLITLEDMAQWANERSLTSAGPGFRWLGHINLGPMLAVAPAAVTIIH